MHWESHWLAVKFVFRRDECVHARRAEKFLYLIPITYFCVIAIENKNYLKGPVVRKSKPDLLRCCCSFCSSSSFNLGLCTDPGTRWLADSLNCTLGTCPGNVNFGWFYLLVFDKWWFQGLVGVWYSPATCTVCRVYSDCQENLFWCVSQNLVHSVQVRWSSLIATALSWRLCQLRGQPCGSCRRGGLSTCSMGKLLVGNRQNKMPWKQWPLGKADSDLPLPRWHNKSDAPGYAVVLLTWQERSMYTSFASRGTFGFSRCSGWEMLLWDTLHTFPCFLFAVWD